MSRVRKVSICLAFLADVMQILRALGHKRMAWKNGGGETTEIIVSPPEASMDDFDWRISMATVTQDGAFSSFPGVDRTLAVLSGEGIELTVADRPVVTLLPTSLPHTFPADVDSSASLMGGAVADLNVMTARQRYRHQVQPVSGRIRFVVEPGTLVVAVSTAIAHLGTAHHQVDLGCFDAVTFGSVDEDGCVEITAQDRVFLITISRYHP